MRHRENEPIAHNPQQSSGYAKSRAGAAGSESWIHLRAPRSLRGLQLVSGLLLRIRTKIDGRLVTSVHVKRNRFVRVRDEPLAAFPAKTESFAEPNIRRFTIRFRSKETAETMRIGYVPTDHDLQVSHLVSDITTPCSKPIFQSFRCR
jgi:hypothetical protein